LVGPRLLGTLFFFKAEELSDDSGLANVELGLEVVVDGFE